MRPFRHFLIAATAASPLAMLGAPAAAQENDFNVWAAQVINICLLYTSDAADE